MKPHVLLIEPMMPEVEARLGTAHCVPSPLAVRPGVGRLIEPTEALSVGGGNWSSGPRLWENG
jgi:hypothetical protein